MCLPDSSFAHLKNQFGDQKRYSECDKTAKTEEICKWHKYFFIYA